MSDYAAQRRFSWSEPLLPYHPQRGQQLALLGHVLSMLGLKPAASAA
jgi:hypothetical protein